MFSKLNSLATRVAQTVSDSLAAGRHSHAQSVGFGLLGNSYASHGFAGNAKASFARANAVIAASAIEAMESMSAALGMGKMDPMPQAGKEQMGRGRGGFAA